MKDYRLSEIKKICEKYSTEHKRLCEECPLHAFVCPQLEEAPQTWDIDENDGEDLKKNKTKKTKKQKNIKKHLTSCFVYGKILSNNK